MQETAMSHFVGYFGNAYQGGIRQRLEEAVDACNNSLLSVPECAKRIMQEFMASLVTNFQVVEPMDPKTALDRELQLMYAADLAATYVILFCPLKVRHELYKHLWGNGAFLDGSIDWLCCPWVLNQSKHDEGYHRVSVKLSELTNNEIIDIIRLHKNYLSTDYVKQRSRHALKQLDRHSLLSVFQSVMMRVLWGHEAVTEEQQSGADGNVDPTEGIQHYIRQIGGGKDEEEQELRRNSLSEWLEEYRSKRKKKEEMAYHKPEKLRLRETDQLKEMKKSISVINRHLEKFNETFRGLPGDMPFSEAIRRRNCESITGVSDLGDTITIDRVRKAFKVLLDFYRDSLVDNAEIYGTIPNIRCLKLLKLMLSYEKHELTALLAATLMALPEFKPIKTEQEFAQYAMLSVNTLAKLCFIAAMRINPDAASADIDLEEVEANSYFAETGDDCVANTANDDTSAGDSDTNAGVDDIASMVFTLSELEPVSTYMDNNRYKVVDAHVSDESKRCIILSSQRTRLVTEAILMHMSNYEDVCDILKDRDIHLPNVDQEDMTMEAIRKHKLAATLKTMTDDELENVYENVINRSLMDDYTDIPNDIYKMSFHSALESVEEELDDESVYTKLTQLLRRMDKNDSEHLGYSSTTGASSSEYETDVADDEHDTTLVGTDLGAAGEVLTERQNYLKLLEGEDLEPFLDKTYSSTNPEEMTDSELMILCDKVLERVEKSDQCSVIHYDPGGKKIRRNSLNALPTRKTATRELRGICTTPAAKRHGFRVFAMPEVTSDYTFTRDMDIDQTQDEQQYGVGIFPQRMMDPRDFSWQNYDKMMKFVPISNRVVVDGVEQYTLPWRKLGLGTEVARAAVAWIRKKLLDTINKHEQANLEIKPTDIQTMAIEHILKDKGDAVIASNAASGKTLAYLLPIIHKLKQDEKHRLRYPNAPRALILVPTRELADQTLDVLKGLGHVVKISSESIAGGKYKGIQRDKMKRLVDIVVATPERLLKMLNHVKLHKLQYVVLDEADTLLNEGFWPDVSKVLDVIKEPYKLIQVAASTKYLLHFEKVQKALAKIPNMKGIANNTAKVNDRYLDRITRCHQLVDTAWVDRPNRGVSHEFRYLGGKDKGLELVNLIKYEDARRCRKIVVFCNNVNSCRAVEYILRDAGLPATSLHGKIPIMQRRKYYTEFIHGSEGILVCTDLASRGLDFNADAVIMFDFPLNSMEYLKRCGRAGRMINNDHIAPEGYAISLVKKRDRNLAMAIERSIRMPFFPISNLSRHKEDYNQRSGRLRYLTQAGGYFKLAKLIRQEEIKGTYDYVNMDQYLEQFKEVMKESYARSLKKIVLRRRRICKRRRILTRRLRLMKRYNKAIRLKQRIISLADRRRRMRRHSVHAPLKGGDRRCPPMKDLRPIRAKILELKDMEQKLTRRLLERNDKNMRKFINKTQLVARSLRRDPESSEEIMDRQIPFNIIQQAKEKIGKAVKRICSLL
ncbi:RNA helicase family protein [Babesia ovis]|uniref:RNA helicase family protein n=1 Tax=Babesia ovis TaxID=5869 RepID=A0A9W5WTE9_BABOV|nr:RNA helicase family protein [Babesia ovis]